MVGARHRARRAEIICRGIEPSAAFLVLAALYAAVVSGAGAVCALCFFAGY